MPQITYKDTAVSIAAPESVLEGLERAGFNIPFSCRSGLCHSCMMQSNTAPPVTSQQGLSENQKAQHLFLACSCIPSKDMDVSLMGNANKIQGTVVGKELLNLTVLALSIQVDCRWFPGQYLTVWQSGTGDSKQGRSYSIASRCDQNQIIELHIKRHDQGLVSRWLHDDIEVGSAITLSKPMGNCFYTEEHSTKPLLMVSTGTGLAPLYGILQEALYKEHSETIMLYAAAGDPDNLYYVEKLKGLSKQYKNFQYIPAVRRGLAIDGEQQAGHSSIVEEDVVNLVQQRHTDLKGWKVFLCGSPDMIKTLQRHCFFQGAAVNDILVDAFVINKPDQ